MADGPFDPSGWERKPAEMAFPQQRAHDCLDPRAVLRNETGVLRVNDAIGPAGTTEREERRIKGRREGVRYQNAERRERMQLDGTSQSGTI